jgi:hypothetical protein
MGRWTIALARLKVVSKNQRYMFYTMPDTSQIFGMSLPNCMGDADRAELVRRPKR